jgi:hypothetical protein
MAKKKTTTKKVTRKKAVKKKTAKKSEAECKRYCKKNDIWFVHYEDYEVNNHLCNALEGPFAGRHTAEQYLNLHYEDDPAFSVLNWDQVMVTRRYATGEYDGYHDDETPWSIMDEFDNLDRVCIKLGAIQTQKIYHERDL